jgi:hypothetical protein
MTKLACAAVTALMLISAGCASMDGHTGSAGNPTNLSDSSLYSGGN